MLTDLEARTLKVIRDSGEISRLEISKLLNLSKPVISQAVAQLINKGLVVESNICKSSIGRPRINLKFVSDAFYCIGAELEENTFEIIITDLSGNEKKAFQERIPHTKDSLDIIEWCSEKIKELIRQSNLPREKFLGIGIGISAMVEPNTGLVRTAPAFGMKDFNLQNTLQMMLDLPVYVANRVKLAAFAEHKLGAAKGFKDVLFIYLDSGLGSAVILNDELFQGFYGKAGEFGWLITDIDVTKDDICEEQNFGHLARKISGHCLRKYLGEIVQDTDLREIIMAIKQGQIEMGKKLRRSLMHLAAAIANSILMFDPQIVIIKGRIGQRYFSEILEIIEQFLYEFLPLQFYENLEFRKGMIDKYDVALGGVFLVQKKVMNI
ncbi:ROK family transcriptional regulator [Thermotoga profunda]|uniref:ROK family transcriptional regulator n=1 Tax=Thermotoga profunda TaxID=1508420 RepID=UPI0005977C41|nr:ROK family transcriptional regulator [Thermotoga profunda]